MKELYRIIGTLCVTAYITGIMLNFVNTTHTRKAVRLIAMLTLISAIFTDTNYIDVIPDFKFINYEDKSEEVNTYIIENAEKLIEKNIKDELDKKNISYTNIVPHINISDGKVKLECVDVYGVFEEEYKYVYNCLKDIVPESAVNIEG